jgi:hypothetical protein
MDTNYTLVKSNSKYEKCWIKHIKVLDRCIDFTPVGMGGAPEGLENDKLEICYEIFKKNYQECISYNSLYFNKIVK